MRPKKIPLKGKANIQRPQGSTQSQKKQGHSKGWLNNRNLLLSLVLIITFIVFLPTLSADFIETWDDGVYVTDNTTIIDLQWQNLKAIFTEPQNGTYVPLPMLSFALEYKIFGLNPLPFHLNNLLLHLLCTAFSFFILILLRLPFRYAALGALLFGIHPMRVETVAWVTERKDLLFSVFYLGAVITYIKYIISDTGKMRYFMATLVLFVLSLFSKIQAVSLPLALLMIDYYLDRPLKMKLIWEKIPLFALSLGFGLMGYFILQQAGSLEINEHFTLFERVLFGLFSLGAYLVKLFAPLKLSAFYPYPIKPGESLPILYYLSPFFLLALAVLVYLTAKKTKAVVFGTMFFLVNIMFLLQILGAGQGYQADRFTYIPYLGLFFLAGWAAQRYAERSKAAQPILIFLILGFSVFFSVSTLARSRVWKNSMSLWTDVIEKYPGKIATAYTNRATTYRKANQAELALADYNTAISLESRDGTARMNRGNIYFDMGQDSLAFLDYRASLNLKMNKNQKQTEIYKLYGNLGAIYGRRGIYDSAFYFLDLSLSIDSTFAAAWMNRGLTYEVMGKWENAISDFSRYLRYNPEDEKVHSDVGVCYQNLGKFRESLVYFDRCISLKPQTGFYYLNRSYSYNAMKEMEKARQDALKARELGHQVPPEYMQYLGIQ